MIVSRFAGKYDKLWFEREERERIASGEVAGGESEALPHGRRGLLPAYKATEADQASRMWESYRRADRSSTRAFVRRKSKDSSDTTSDGRENLAIIRK